MMSRNSKWSRDELILALELYFRLNPVHTSEENPEIQRLSETLNALPIHPAVQHGAKFRNANGVYMKLCNFLRLDPGYTGTGLDRVGKLEEVIWHEFADERDRLRAVAASIRAAITEVPPPADAEEAAIDEDAEFPEGRVLAQLHRRRERNPKIAKLKKQRVMQETGTLACEACGFDYSNVYGALGREFAECHHRSPLSDLAEAKKTKLADLAIVCANCHRMLHRARPWKSVEELRTLIEAERRKRGTTPSTTAAPTRSSHG